VYGLLLRGVVGAATLAVTIVMVIGLLHLANANPAGHSLLHGFSIIWRSAFHAPHVAG